MGVIVESIPPQKKKGKSATKKPAAAKTPSVTKKPAAAAKPAPAARPAPAAKPEPAARPEPAAKPVKQINRVQIRVQSKSARKPAAKPVEPVPVIDTAKAVAFAMSIAQEMKRSAKNEDQKRNVSEIHLSRRPTTRSQGKNTVTFPPNDLKDFRKRLLAEREKALEGVVAMKATGFNESEDREADGGDGTNQTLRLQALGQMGLINRTIQQIEEALHRIDDGTYGVCTVCGQLIRKPRLLNQPFVLTCMECQSEMERNRG